MNKNELFLQETKVSAEQISILEDAASTVPNMVEKKEDGGYRVTDFPITVETPNASLHLDSNGVVTSGHNAQEVERILDQISYSVSKKRE